MIKTIAKRLLPLILALVVMISLFPAVAASAADYTLSGYWLFDATFSTTNEYDISQDILFTSNGQAFSSITYVKDQTSGTPSLSFCAIKYNSVQVKEFAWTDQAYRYVDFGSTPQTVSATFYTWFTSHATQQARPETTYYVSIDGSSFQYPSTADSITLDLIITANDYKLSVDGSEEDYRISDTVLNDDRQQFAGLSVNGVVDQVDYGIGRHEIILTPSDPPLLLGTVWKSPLYIDPNGGTWNGSSSVSVFWELANTDTEDIYDPVRPGYTFNGWTFTGDGEFIPIGDPPYIFEHGTAPGYLTANWIADSPDPEPDPGTGNTYTTTIIIAGKTLTFTGSGASPDITVTDTGYSVQFTDGVTTKTLSYDILGVTAATFAGLSFTQNGTTFLSPGGSYVIEGLTGSDCLIELYPISQDVPDSNAYTTTIVINGKPFEFCSSESYPEVQIRVREAAVQMSDGSSIQVYSYLGTGVFDGLGTSASGDVSYPVGSEIVCIGSSTGNRFMFYVKETLPPSEEEFEGGVLGWLKLIFEKITSLGISPEIKASLSVVDFGSVGSFFVDMYQNVTSVFGLRTLIEDPAGPFAWLMAS